MGKANFCVVFESSIGFPPTLKRTHFSLYNFAWESVISSEGKGKMGGYYSLLLSVSVATLALWKGLFPIWPWPCESFPFFTFLSNGPHFYFCLIYVLIFFSFIFYVNKFCVLSTFKQLFNFCFTRIKYTNVWINQSTNTYWG